MWEVETPSLGGVLLALPALLVMGLLRHTRRIYELPKGLLRDRKYLSAADVDGAGRATAVPCAGGVEQSVDRIPEVRCLRKKLRWLCRAEGRAAQRNAALAEDWMIGLEEGAMLCDADSHVRVYHGELTALARHYMPRQRLCGRATTDYWINVMDGQPVLLR